MSQEETPGISKQKAIKTDHSKAAVSLCHVHDKVKPDERGEIREKVCSKDARLYPHTDGNDYCLLHLPSREKDIAAFEDDCNQRLNAADDLNIVDNVNKYDFRYVWFPSVFDLAKRRLASAADFSYATFSGEANFNSANFLSARFVSTTFASKAEFRFSSFSGRADFSSATFEEEAYFEQATFKSAAIFASTVFKSSTSFREATFASEAGFYAAKLLETAEVFFNGTKFCGLITFYGAIIDGYLKFEEAVFLQKGQKAGLAEEIRVLLDDNQEASLSFGQSHLNRPDRISFSSMPLRPSWFVNAEVRNFGFNNVAWQNLEIDIDRRGLNSELERLVKNRFSNPVEALRKACIQLADNAEANSRLDEAKKFRKQGIALRNEPCHVDDAVELSKKKAIRDAVCQDFPVVNEDGGNFYCLWHSPDKNKSEIFLQEFIKRGRDGHSDYRAVKFPVYVSFSGNLYNLDFRQATFLRRVVFKNAAIQSLDFEKANFKEEAELIFESSTCNGSIKFEKAVFEGKFFLNGTENYEFFQNPELALSFKDARFDNPRSINFRSVRLRPHYFVDVDASEFVFHDCDWKDANGSDLDIKDELRLCSNKELAKTANQIAINYEETRNFEESTTFRYMAMQTKRYEYWLHGWFFTLNWLYWWSSGYGERRVRAGLNLLLVLVLFGLLYSTSLARFDYSEKDPPRPMRATDRQKNPEPNNRNPEPANNVRYHSMEPIEGFVHSLSVAAFQRPEPKPADTMTKFIVFLETILAPLQAALLALAIRRKFMR